MSNAVRELEVRLDSYDAKERGKPSILAVHLDSLPIPEFWVEHFSDIENNYVWK